MTAPRQFLIYQSEDGATRIDVMLEAETLWLNQKQLTELFGKAKGAVSEHSKHIFEEDEPSRVATVRNDRTVQSRGGGDVVREVAEKETGVMDFGITDSYLSISTNVYSNSDRHVYNLL